jgi:Abortive infection alpha
VSRHGLGGDYALSFVTRRWRVTDSNLWFPVRRTMLFEASRLTAPALPLRQRGGFYVRGTKSSNPLSSSRESVSRAKLPCDFRSRRSAPGASRGGNPALGSTPEDLIAYLGGDWLRVRRAENLVKLLEQAKARLAERNVQEPIPASLSIAFPILRDAADEDREELVDLWARLLANAMDPNLNSVRQSFIEAVKKMDPMDAVVLRHLHEAKITLVSDYSAPSSTGTTGITNIAREIDRRDDEVEVSIRHLKDLLFVDEHSFIEGEDDEQHERLSWWVNAAGREFLRACYPKVKTE